MFSSLRGVLYVWSVSESVVRCVKMLYEGGWRGVCWLCVLLRGMLSTTRSIQLIKGGKL